jgi:hypothetical protein
LTGFVTLNNEIIIKELGETFTAKPVKMSENLK